VKHGIYFVQAQALREDPDVMEIPLKASDDPGFPVIAKILDKHWSGIIAYRNGRITPVRRSRREEVGLYEG
jgi:uncharacterized protein